MTIERSWECNGNSQEIVVVEDFKGTSWDYIVGKKRQLVDITIHSRGSIVFNRYSDDLDGKK